MSALPYPTPLATAPGQTDARDANGRQDAYLTAAGTPVLVVDPAGQLYLVTIHYQLEERRAWCLGPPARIVYFASRLGLSAEVAPAAVIDQTLPPARWRFPV